MGFVGVVLLVLLSVVSTAEVLAAAPELAIDQPTFTFGTVTQGRKVQHAFSIRNRGTAPLAIRRIRPSCGCTAASSSASVLQPGAQTEIKVTFDSTNFAGSISKTVALETDDPKLPVATLTLKGTVAEELQVTPRQLNLGRIKADTAVNLTVTIANRGSRAQKLLSATSPLPQVVARIERGLLKPGESCVVKVSVTPRATDRFLSGYLTILTDNPAKPEITVPIFGSLAQQPAATSP